MSTDTLSDAPSRTAMLRRSWPLIRPQRRVLALTGVVSLAAAMAELAGPVLVGAAVDAVVGREHTRLRLVAAAYAILAVSQFGLDRARRQLAAATGERFLAGLRDRVAATLVDRPLGFFDRHRPGELLARATGDVNALSSFVREGLPAFVDAGLLFVVGVAVLTGASWQLALVSLVYVPGALLAIRRFRRASATAYATHAQRGADATAAIGESITSRETIQASVAESRWMERFGGVDDALVAANDGAIRADNRLSILGFWQLITIAAVIAAGGLLVDADRATVGAVVTVVLALRQLFAPVESVTWLYGEAQAASANLARLLELIELGPSCSAQQPIPATQSAPGPLELVEVTHRYGDGTAAISGVCLRIEPGEHLAVIGPSGAGKSTVAKVAAGLLEPTSGTVTLAGRDLGEFSTAELRRRVVMLLQDGHVFSGTLAENLRLVPGDHSDAELESAVDRAGLRDWVSSLPSGLDSPLAGGGTSLSSGEQQLVALARAALADPEVLILDEATADVDPATEATVAASLARLGEHRTVVVISHRLATAARYARVVRIESGAITGDGPPAEVITAGTVT